MDRVFNFAAGPSAMPAEALETAAREMLNFGGHGMSVMEMSHRSKMYIEIFDDQNTAQSPAGIDGLFRMLIDQLHRADTLLRKRLSIQKNLTFRGFQIPGHQLDQGGLSVTAGGKQRNPLSTFHTEADIVKN